MVEHLDITDRIETGGLFRPGAGPGIIFFHGMCAGAIHFEDAFEHPALADRALAAINLPGFAGSSAIPGATVSEIVEFLEKAFEDLGLADRPLIVAHSLAGSLAARLTPNSSGVCLIEGNVLPEHLFFVRDILKHDDSEFEGFFARLQRTANVLLRTQTRNVAGEKLARFAALYSDCSAETVRHMANIFRIEVESGETLTRFSECNVPLMVVWADNGAYGASLPALRRQLPISKEASISNAGHFVMIDQPDRTYGLIADFADQLDL